MSFFYFERKFKYIFYFSYNKLKMIAWTDEERNKHFRYMSKQYNISIKNAKYITEQCEEYLKAMITFSIDFEKALKLNDEYKKMLITRYSRTILMDISSDVLPPIFSSSLFQSVYLIRFVIYFAFFLRY
jgi:hypothetical protein